ncbi:RsiV family protein [Speluncibacter jeojiensis]|uniref:RsiV family protein n=1 Tax=Speluncibacter jeojiensis TaxID=2710754 RepID=A0A9X4LXJ2_9ACTN|nr:RsiV family protein [Corynebacteriales bacterium D3-21]
MHRRTPAVLGAVALTALVAAGCSDAGPARTAAATPSPTGAAAASTIASATASSKAPSTAASASDAGYRQSTIRVDGQTDRARYDVQLPQVEGGDPTVSARYDSSMRAALRDQIDGDYGEGMHFTLTGGEDSTTTVSPGTVSGLLQTSWDADPPGAHSTALLATVVIDRKTARPITLAELFPDEQAGLQRLSEESAKLLPDTVVGSDYDATGIAPVEHNFANWLPTAQGMQIHFLEYQVGPYAAGLVTITIPWEHLRDVVAPGLYAAVSS